jgi:hypothetical protein
VQQEGGRESSLSTFVKKIQKGKLLFKKKTFLDFWFVLFLLSLPSGAVFNLASAAAGGLKTH